jgi:hypothetical protein
VSAVQYVEPFGIPVMYGNVMVQDLPHKPKYLLTLTAGAAQKQVVNDAISKVSSMWTCTYVSVDVYVFCV